MDVMIKLSILFRLFISYIVILAMIVIVISYSISQIDNFENLISSFSKNNIKDYKQKLSDSLLAQMRYERKYIISKDKTRYNQFLSAKNDFSKYLKEFAAVISPTEKNKLDKIKTYYEHYQFLTNEEIKKTISNQRYSQSWYKKEKDKTFYAIIKELGKFEFYDLYKKKIEELQKANSIFRLRVSVMSIIVFCLVFLIFFSIVKTITIPINVVIEKTKKIAKGHFDGDLNISYPKEIGELANSINLMSNKLKELDKMKSDFFSNISHELRTPLTSIKEGIALFKETIGENLTDKQKMLLRIIAEESNRLIKLVNSILDLSKMEARMMSFNYAYADIVPLINNVVLEIEPLAIAKNINLKVENGQNLPMVKMDQERILQVLLNFIGNAVKFTPPNGHVNISVIQNNGNMQVSVKDTGPGIEREKLKTIFERFQQLSLESSNSNNGTGLGLAIVKHIVTGHGGKVWAESRIGEGSLFAFTLPF